MPNSSNADDDIFHRIGLTPVSEYAERMRNGDSEWLADAIEEYLGFRVTYAQRQICRSLCENTKTLVMTGNSLGKSYILAAIINVWQTVCYSAITIATSATYQKLKRTLCRPVENLHSNALGGIGLPGEYKQQPPRLDYENDPEHYFEAASPKDSGELEGAHARYTLGLIEEADKEGVDEELVDAMNSLLSDDRDRLIMIANPPDPGTANVVEPRLGESSPWNVIRLSSFESHNVRVELGKEDGPMIDGLATLDKIKDDWNEYNGVPWPGVEAARTSHTDETLDKRWFKRRLGRIPPTGATVHRPIYPGTVDLASFSKEDWARRSRKGATRQPQGLGLDVARTGGDSCALVGIFGDEIRVLDVWTGTDHVYNERHVRELLCPSWDCPFAIDSTPEGSGLSDRIDRWYPVRRRFMAGRKAVQGMSYYDYWAEGLHALGHVLEDGARFCDSRLREELEAAAAVVEYEEKHYASRGPRGADVYKATPKSEIKEKIDRSPDVLDAAMQAAWAKEVGSKQIAADHTAGPSGGVGFNVSTH
jgi:hypothetical protein